MELLTGLGNVVIFALLLEKLLTNRRESTANAVSIPMRLRQGLQCG
jgi:hypothetical protein